MSIPGIKAVQIGLGFGYACKFGSEVHDPIYHSKNKGFYRQTNNAGGIEGGVSNGEDIILSACMKPISTLLSPLDSVNIKTKAKAKASIERSDICVVEAAGVIAEAAVAFELAGAYLDKFGCDALSDIKASYRLYLKRVK
jgi:chorismate synthase